MEKQKQQQQIPISELELPKALESLIEEALLPEIGFDQTIGGFEGPTMILDHLHHQQLASMMFVMENDAQPDLSQSAAYEAGPCRPGAVDMPTVESSATGSTGGGGEARRCADEEDVHGCRRRRERRKRMHNIAKRRRRSLVNEKLKDLLRLLPNSQKLDKATVLDRAISYIRSLQNLVQFPMDPYALRPLPFPAMEYPPVMMRSAGISMAMTNTDTGLGQAPAGSTPLAPRPRGAAEIAPAPSATFRPSTTFCFLPPQVSPESSFPARSLP